MKTTFLTAILTMVSLVISAQSIDLTYYLPQHVTYDPTIPTPKSIIGHEVGEWHVTHDKLVYYMRALAESTDRIKIEERGTTYEGRPLILLTITSPKNQQNLEAIRQKHLQLSEPGAEKLDVSSMPIVINQGFSIHGNEPSGSNAALAVAYYYAAAQGPEIENQLDQAIILFDPSFNPDGLNRFATWANMHKSKNINPDPNDREYRESWPGGRTNHYWFDMNRDWLPVQLPESNSRQTTFHNWHPNILTDHHEMGTNSTFFFQPGIPERTHPLTPKLNQELTAAIGQYHAEGLDKIGSLYYSEEDYDDFYYGKGSTYPDVNGSIGILFEQASSRGHAQESDHGILTFPFTIRNQFTAALSTLKAGVALKNQLLNFRRQFYADALKEATDDIIVFGDETDAARTNHLAEILLKHQIEVYQIKNDFSHEGKNYRKGYAYMVPKKQKQTRLIEAIFEKRTTFEDSLFYDISAWSFPLAFNMDYHESAPKNQLGNQISSLPAPPAPNFPISDYAYLIKWNEYYAPKALNHLLQQNVLVKVAMQPFTLQDNDYDYGTLMIPVALQNTSKDQLHELLTTVAQNSSIEVHSVATGWTSKGIDLGSRNFETIKKPQVAILVGDGITYADAGEIWHLFDQRFDILLTKLDTRSFSRMDISRYTHIIIPNAYGGAIDQSGTENIKNWVQAGGTLITYKNATTWAANHDLINVKFKSNRNVAEGVSFENRRNFNGARGVGGTIFETRLDRTHPIAFGYKNETLPLFKNASLIMEANEQSYNNPILYLDKPLMSGYIHDTTYELLKNSSAFRASAKGSGTVIAFTENTNFRAFWFGTNKLLMNAIFFGDKMR